jgi:hypothetical protein
VRRIEERERNGIFETREKEKSGALWRIPTVLQSMTGLDQH